MIDKLKFVNEIVLSFAKNVNHIIENDIISEEHILYVEKFNINGKEYQFEIIITENEINLLHKRVEIISIKRLKKPNNGSYAIPNSIIFKNMLDDYYMIDGNNFRIDELILDDWNIEQLKYLKNDNEIFESMCMSIIHENLYNYTVLFNLFTLKNCFVNWGFDDVINK